MAAMEGYERGPMRRKGGGGGGRMGGDWGGGIISPLFVPFLPPTFLLNLLPPATGKSCYIYFEGCTLSMGKVHFVVLTC